MIVTAGMPPTPKEVPVLRLKITREDDKPVNKWWNLVAKKAIWQIKDYVEDGSIYRKDLIVIKRGIAPKADYEIQIWTR